MNGIGTKVDTRVQLVFEQSQIFIAGPEQGLNIGRDFQGFIDQADEGPPAAPWHSKSWSCGCIVGFESVAELSPCIRRPGTGSFLPVMCLPPWTIPRMRTD
jgi:hypothetical protein